MPSIERRTCPCGPPPPGGRLPPAGTRRLPRRFPRINHADTPGRMGLQNSMGGTAQQASRQTMGALLRSKPGRPGPDGPLVSSRNNGTGLPYSRLTGLPGLSRLPRPSAQRCHPGCTMDVASGPKNAASVRRSDSPASLICLSGPSTDPLQDERWTADDATGPKAGVSICPTGAAPGPTSVANPSQSTTTTEPPGASAGRDRSPGHPPPRGAFSRHFLVSGKNPGRPAATGCLTLLHPLTCVPTPFRRRSTFRAGARTCESP